MRAGFRFRAATPRGALMFLFGNRSDAASTILYNRRSSFFLQASGQFGKIVPTRVLSKGHKVLGDPSGALLLPLQALLRDDLFYLGLLVFILISRFTGSFAAL